MARSGLRSRQGARSAQINRSRRVADGDNYYSRQFTMNPADYTANDIYNDHGWDTDLDDDVDSERTLTPAATLGCDPVMRDDSALDNKI